MKSKTTHCPRCHALGPQYELPDGRLARVMGLVGCSPSALFEWQFSAWLCIGCGCPYLVAIPEGLTPETWEELSGVPRNGETKAKRKGAKS